MGLTQSISDFWARIFGKKEMKFIMIGLDAVGKTSILYKLKLGETIQPIPTIGFNLETVKYKNLTFKLWDIGGGDKIRLLWASSCEGVDGIIFVFNSQELCQFREELAAEELHRLSSEVAGYDVPILIFANKQDCENAMRLEEITKVLHPKDLKHKRWHIQPCSAKTGDRLYEGLEWLGLQTQKNQNKSSENKI